MPSSPPLTTQAAHLLAAPVAARRPKAMTKFGDRRVDDYHWLREKADPEVIAYLDAENRYAAAVMKPLEAFREKLYEEMLARILETDESVPYRYRGYWYYVREVEGLQYPLYCRREGTMQAPEEVILDENELAKGHAYTEVGAMAVSPDGTRLAYTVDYTGFRQHTLFVKDLASGRLLRDTHERVTSLAWALDSRTLFLVEEDEKTKRSHQLFRHRLEGASELIFEEADELYNIGVYATRSEQFLILSIGSKDTTEMRVLDAAAPEGDFRLVEPRRDGHEYYLDHHEADWYIRTNDKGPNFRLARAPVADPSRRHWREVVPHRPMVSLEEVDTFKAFWVLTERDKGILRLRVTDFASGASHYIAFDEPVHVVNASVNEEYDTHVFRFVYESMVTPRSWYDYDVRDRSRTLLKRQPVLGGYDPAQYVSEALTATGHDGVRIPISLVYRKSLRREGEPQPLLLYGYGAYGYPMDPWFRSARISLLDRGMIFAIAHVRGGGDRGRAWYDEGKLQKKRNTFDDFICAAESLVRRRYTSPDRLLATGGSAGGLLMGAVVNMRPELWKAVVLEVPFVDVLTTMLDPTLPLTVPEYLEWGDPNRQEAYRYIRSYSPYDNLRKGEYPAMLVETSLNDSQVMYWEPAKYVAKLRTLKTDRNPLLLKTTMEAGHGGSSGRYDALKELAFTFTFILDQAGLAQ